MLDDDGALRRHRRAGPEDDGRSAPSAATRSCLATGGPGIIFGTLDQQRHLHRHRRGAASTSRAPSTRNGEFIQVHPTAIPGDDKLRLISESARGEGGRVWVPKDAKRQARSRKDIPESERYYFLEREVPRVRQPRPPRHRLPRDLQDLLPRGPRHLQRRRPARTRTRSTSTSPTRTRRSSRKKLAGILEIYEKFVGVDPVQEPDEGLPRRPLLDGRPVGRLREGRARIARGRAPAQPGDQHPRPLRRRRGRLPVPRRQPPRRQLAALLHLRRHGRRARRWRRYRQSARDERVRSAVVDLREGREARARRLRAHPHAEPGRQERREPVRAPPGARRDDAPRRAPSSATTACSTRCSRRSTSSTSASNERRRHRHLARARTRALSSCGTSRTCCVLARVIARARRTATSRAARTTSPSSPSATTQNSCAPRWRATRSEGAVELRPRVRLHVRRQDRARHRRGRRQPGQAARAQVRASRRGERRSRKPATEPSSRDADDGQSDARWHSDRFS